MSLAKKMGAIPSHFKVAISNWLLRLCNMLIQLVSVPLLTRSLGDDGFAGYTLTVALLSWYALLDLGLGNSLQNLLSEARAAHRDFAPYLVSALVASLFVFLLATSVLYAASPFLSQFLLPKIQTIDAVTKERIILVSGIFFIANTTGNVCIKALYALERGMVANALLLCANITSFALLLGALNWAPEEKLLQWSLFAYSAPLGILGFGLPLFLFHKYVVGRHVKWAPLRTQLSHIIELLARSHGFWWLALWGTVIYNVDFLIMSQLLSTQDIAVYSVFQRVFAAAMALYSGLLNATWPHWSTCIIKGDWKSVTQSIRTYLLVAISTSIVISIAALLLKSYVFDLLLPGNRAIIPGSLILLFGMYSVMRIWADTFSVSLLAANETRVFLRYAPFQAAIGFSLQTFLATYFGLQGILVGLILSLLLTAVWILPRHLKKVISGKCNRN